MGNRIISSLIIVFLFWWIVIWIGDGAPMRIGNGVESQVNTDVLNYILAACAGFLSTFSVSLFLLISRRRALKKTENRFCSCTTGPVPGWLGLPASSETMIDESRWPKLAGWVEALRDSPSLKEEFDFVLEVLAVLYARRQSPSSPVKGGHGGLGLFDHTCNVLEYGICHLHEWSHPGVIQGASGNKTHAGLKGVRIDASEHHWVLLLLLCHDLGKLVAWAEDRGEMQVLRPWHDRESARVMAFIESFWSLPDEGREDLIDAVSHTHRPAALPAGTRPRVWVWLAFLKDMDSGASRLEEDQAMAYRQNNRRGKPWSIPFIACPVAGRPGPAQADPDDLGIRQILPDCTVFAGRGPSV